MLLINKTTFNITTVNNNGSNLSRLDWLELSQDQYNEIVSKFYNIGTLDEVVTVDLRLVTGLNITQTTDLFNKVDTIIYLDRDEAISKYEDEKINKTFKDKKIRLFIPNYKLIIDNGFDKTAIVMQENDGVIKEFKTLDAGLVECSLYLDFISSDDKQLIAVAIENGLIVETLNPTKS